MPPHLRGLDPSISCSGWLVSGWPRARPSGCWTLRSEVQRPLPELNQKWTPKPSFSRSKAMVYCSAASCGLPDSRCALPVSFKSRIAWLSGFKQAFPLCNAAEPPKSHPAWLEKGEASLPSWQENRDQSKATHLQLQVWRRAGHHGCRKANRVLLTETSVISHMCSATCLILMIEDVPGRQMRIGLGIAASQKS